jgi:hypothetical protein
MFFCINRHFSVNSYFSISVVVLCEVVWICQKWLHGKLFSSKLSLRKMILYKWPQMKFLFLLYLKHTHTSTSHIQHTHRAAAAETNCVRGVEGGGVGDAAAAAVGPDQPTSDLLALSNVLISQEIGTPICQDH